MKDPVSHLAGLDPPLTCPVHPDRPAVLDATTLARVNHEIYFLSGPAAREAFERDPLRYCGAVTDPVSGERFRPSADSPREQYLGRPYFFATAENREIFTRRPRDFAEPKRVMVMDRSS